MINVEQPASHARGELGRKPLPVRYACGLLRLQAVLWAVAAVGFAGLWIAGMAMMSDSTRLGSFASCLVRRRRHLRHCGGMVVRRFGFAENRSLPYNSAAMEGNVNKIKLIKRQMFGRAGFPLLRKRVIHHPA